MGIEERSAMTGWYEKEMNQLTEKMSRNPATGTSGRLRSKLTSLKEEERQVDVVLRQMNNQLEGQVGESEDWGEMERKKKCRDIVPAVVHNGEGTLERLEGVKREVILLVEK